MTIIAGLIRRFFDLDEKKDGPPPPSPPGQEKTGPEAPGPAVSPAEPPAAAPQGSVASARVLKQAGLLAGGVAFMGLSIAVSRRAVRRQFLAQRPPFYDVNRSTPVTDEAFKKTKREPLLALEALKLGTLNVAAFSIALVGAVSLALDVSSVDELRTRLRAPVDRAGGEAAVDEEAERALAEWMWKYLKLDPDELEEAARKARKEREEKEKRAGSGSGPSEKN